MKRFAPLLAALAAACTPVQALNTADRLVSPGVARQVVADVAYGADPRQRLDVYSPRHAGHAPVLVFFYGGNWSSGRRQDYGFAARAFAAQGFVVVVPDYRLVPAIRYPAFVEDGAAAIGWTVRNIARFGGDPASLAIAGHSAGAYTALMLALDPRWLAAAKLPPDTVRAAVGLAGPYDFYPFDKPASIAAFGAFADGPSTQPVNHVRTDAPPVLLLHGGKDETVRPRNSEALFAALKAKGAEATLKLYPAIDHVEIVMALARPFRGKAPVVADVAAFLKAKLAQAR